MIGPMQLFVVGGAVRDRLLGEPVHDRDWVAVGATPQELLALGYKPVGKDFPVFLHPVTGEEVALARTERKSGRGYHGFTFHAAPDVTLEQDLARRDLTINAMAEDAGGRVIDPFGGRHDLQRGVLRHVSAAFAEDPVRLLRLARFAARWPHFAVAPETEALLALLVERGEVDALVAERVWQELARGLMARRPSRMFEVLRRVGALVRLLPEPALEGRHLAQLDRAADAGAPLAVSFALMGWPDAASADTAAKRLRASTDVREMAGIFVREEAAVRRIAHSLTEVPSGAAADDVLFLFERCDALRRPDRFEELLQASALNALTGPVADDATVLGTNPALSRLRALLHSARDVDSAVASAAALAAGARGPAVGEAVRQARLAALRAALSSRR
jgi:tRNA nucleotidyltransferase (CCA-adding enzyme)